MRTESLFRPALLFLAMALAFSTSDAIGQHLVSGTVRNGTTGAQTAGDPVLLLRLSRANGMVEESRTVADASGSFTLSALAPISAYVVRVLHGGVNYDRLPSPIGAADVTVFDAKRKIEGIIGYASIMKVESDQSGYSITELHALENNSSPPRTQLSARNLELNLPPKSHLDSVTVVGPDEAIPVKVHAAAVSDGRFEIGFPLRPGMTQYAIRYHLPAGKIAFHPHISYSTRQWTVMFPNTMKFVEHTPGGFHSIIDQNSVRVEAINDVQPGALPGFELSGTGLLPLIQPAAASAPSSPQRQFSAPTLTTGTAAGTIRDGHTSAQAAILIVVSFVPFLTGVMVLAHRRSTKVQARIQRAKDSLFELETSRIQGTISGEEYAARKGLIVSSWRQSPFKIDTT